MAQNIRGITVEIGGETVGLQNALRDVNTRSRELQNELREVERALRFNPGNTTLIAQQQQILTEQVANTTEKLNRLKDAQSQVEQQFRNGEIGADQYRAFQRELVTTESRLNDLRQALRNVDNGSSVNAVETDLAQVENEANDAKGAVKDLGGELAGLAGGLVAGGGIAGAISTALDMSSLDTKIEIQFDVPESSKSSVKEAIKGIEAYGLDAEEALEGVRRQWALNKDASDEVNTMIAKGAGAIASAYSEIDFIELIQETNEIAAGLKVSNEEALALVNSLLKAGFPPEQLDTIAEYGMQMQTAGYNAAEIQAIFEAGIDTKTWNIDNLNDGVKETRIRMAELGESIPKAVTDLLDGTGVNSKKISEWGQAVAEGGDQGSKALSDMVTWLAGIDDKAKQNAIATQLMGTMWEDQGSNMIAVFQGVAGAVDKSTENTNGLYKTMGSINSDPAIELQHAFNRLKEALQPLLTQIVELVSKIANWVAENPKLAATITAVVTAIGILMGILMAVAPIFTALSAASTALGIGLLPLIGIVAGVVAGIAALIAIGVLVYKNWDEIKAKAIEIWGALKEWFSTTLESIKENFTETWGKVKSFMSETWDSVKNTLTEKWNAIKTTASKLWTDIIDGIMSIITPIVENAKETFDSMKSGVEKIFNGLKTFFDGYWKVLKSVFAGALLLIMDLVTGDFEGMKEDAKAIWNTLKEGLKEIWNGIKLVFSGTLDAIKGLVTKGWEDLKTTTANTFYAIRDKLSEIWDSIKTTATNSPEQIKNTASQKFEEMKKSLADKMTAAKNKIVEIWNQVKDFFAGIDLSQIGKDIIQGLIDGIGSMASSLMEKAKGIAEGIKETLRDAFDINSPSRYMRDMIGKNIGEGLIIGLDSMRSSIARASERMANAATPNIPSANSSTSSISKTYAPNIVVQAMPNASPADIARKSLQIQRQLAMEWGY